MDRITQTPAPGSTLGSTPARGGFTLIELLVVISIIALLVGILLPALGAARRTAQNSQCLSNIRQMDTAAMAFAADHEFHVQISSTDLAWGGAGPLPPRLRGRNDAWVSSTGATFQGRIKDWASAIVPYMGGDPKDSFENSDPKVTTAFLCPSDGNQDNEDPGYIIYNNISAGPTDRKPISYAVNADVTTYDNEPFEDGKGNWTNNGNPISPVGGGPVNGSLDAIRGTSKTMVYAECGTRKNITESLVAVNGQILMYTASTAFNSGALQEEYGTLAAIYKNTRGRTKIPLVENNTDQGAGDRHGDKVNVAFADGHATGFSPGEFIEVNLSPHQ